jgi:hypothetical protein
MIEVPGFCMHGMTSQKLNLDKDCFENAECKNKKVFLKLITASNNSIQRKFVSATQSTKSFSE